MSNMYPDCICAWKSQNPACPWHGDGTINVADGSALASGPRLTSNKPSPVDVLDLAARLASLTAERDDLRAAIKEARDVIATKYGPDGTNNLDKPLLSRLDALLSDGA